MKLNEMQENTNQQLNKTRKTMHDENEKFNKENRSHTKDPKRNPRAEK